MTTDGGLKGERIAKEKAAFKVLSALKGSETCVDWAREEEVSKQISFHFLLFFYSNR